MPPLCVLCVLPWGPCVSPLGVSVTCMGSLCHLLGSHCHLPGITVSPQGITVSSFVWDTLGPLWLCHLGPCVFTAWYCWLLVTSHPSAPLSPCAQDAAALHPCVLIAPCPCVSMSLCPHSPTVLGPFVPCPNVSPFHVPISWCPHISVILMVPWPSDPVSPEPHGPHPFVPTFLSPSPLSLSQSPSCPHTTPEDLSRPFHPRQHPPSPCLQPLRDTPAPLSAHPCLCISVP